MKQALCDELKETLKRDPKPEEVENVGTDVGLIVRVLTKDFTVVVAAEAALGTISDVCVPRSIKWAYSIAKKLTPFNSPAASSSGFASHARL